MTDSGARRCAGWRNNYGRSWYQDGERCTKRARAGSDYCAVHAHLDGLVLVKWLKENA